MMPDPIRVTRAVRRCPVCEAEEEHPTTASDADTFFAELDCTDGWVDVPVDEQCPACDKYGYRMRSECEVCHGSGRRLHDWATGWCVGDEVLGGTKRVRYTLTLGHTGLRGQMSYQAWLTARITNPKVYAALVLSDPSHRPEPMRWKQ